MSQKATHEPVSNHCATPRGQRAAQRRGANRTVIGGGSYLISMSPHLDISLYILTVLVYPNACGRRNLVPILTSDRFSWGGCRMPSPYLTMRLQKERSLQKSRTHYTHKTNPYEGILGQRLSWLNTRQNLFLNNLSVSSKYFSQHNSLRFWHISKAVTYHHILFLPSTK